MKSKLTYVKNVHINILLYKNIFFYKLLLNNKMNFKLFIQGEVTLICLHNHYFFKLLNNKMYFIMK